MNGKKKKITLSDVEHVARLARLELSEGEKKKFARQLNDILVYMEKLGELNTGGVEPLTHVLPLKNVFRKDETRPGLGRAEVLNNAPEKRDGFFKVPPVIE
jgi:aspartyl-tRNA(Asn)/glutamyl-tRNA(Gln) amidotransferase subunit C